MVKPTAKLTMQATSPTPRPITVDSSTDEAALAAVGERATATDEEERTAAKLALLSFFGSANGD